MEIDPECVVFDLDGTLAESKARIEDETAHLLALLLDKYQIVVISGGSFKQFETQLISRLIPKNQIDTPAITTSNIKLENLHLMPLSGSELYEYKASVGKWELIHSSVLSQDEREKIIAAIHKALGDVDFALVSKHYGERIEDRGAQITFSALGQEAPIDLKKAWDPDKKKRLALATALAQHLPDFEVHVGGSTSVDVTKRGINKASSLRELCIRMGVKLKDILYIGDDLFPGGNDFIVKSLGIETKEV